MYLRVLEAIAESGALQRTSGLAAGSSSTGAGGEASFYSRLSRLLGTGALSTTRGLGIEIIPRLPCLSGEGKHHVSV